MHTVGKIDKEIYRCITDDIVTEEVIITDNQIKHIRERHPNDYERFAEYFPEIIADPDYIRCEMTPTSVGGEQQISINGGSQSPI